MGLLVLHSGHFSKIFKKLMGTPCSLTWREAGEKERVWVINRGHPIAQGLDPYFVIPQTEMYGEPFAVPEPMETVFISWYDGGEVFRSGLTYQRGAGRIFYFSPGHEVYPIYNDANVQTVLRNAVKWAANPAPALTGISEAPNRPIEKALEPIVERGPTLHVARRNRLPVGRAMVRLLIIGTGGMARQHALSFGSIEGVEIVAAVEPNRGPPGRLLRRARASRTNSPTSTTPSAGTDSTRRPT